MEPDEIQEYQANEISTALANVNDRMEHISGAVTHGLLNGEKLREHQNDRAEAYLEGYVDALEFAAHEINNIQNIARHVPDEAIAQDGGESEK